MHIAFYVTLYDVLFSTQCNNMYRLSFNPNLWVPNSDR